MPGLGESIVILCIILAIAAPLVIMRLVTRWNARRHPLPPPQWPPQP
jgi:hypothetical protein